MGTETYEVLLFSSYCGDENPHCTDKRPCPVCLGMSNVFTVPKSALSDCAGALSPDWNGNRKIAAASEGIRKRKY